MIEHAGSGLYDLHCHLLFGVDDGPKTLDESLALARVLVDAGFEVVTPSPHHGPDFATKEAALARQAELQGALDAEGIGLRLEPSAENVLGEDFIRGLGTPAERLIGKGPYALVEAPFMAPCPALEETIFRIKLARVTPVLAHPERCLEFEKEGRAARAVALGASLQLDLGSLVGRYGPAARRLARRFLDEGLYAVAATDLHSAVRAEGWLERALRELRGCAGAEGFDRLLRVNPRRVLLGQAVEP